MNRLTLLVLLVVTTLLLLACHPKLPAEPRPPQPEIPTPSVDAETSCFGGPAPDTANEDALPLESVPASVDGTLDSVDVRVMGQLDASLVRGLITVKTGDPVDREKIGADVRRLFALGNFEDVVVEASPSNGGWALTYVVRERPLIGKVIFRGVTSERHADVEAAAGQHAGDLYVPSAVHKSVQSVRNHLVEQGHANARVESLVRRTQARSVDLCLWVEAGPEVRVEELLFDGASKLEAEVLLQAVRDAGVEANLPGGRVDMEALERQMLHVTAKYYDAGMVQARVGEPELRYSKDRSRVLIRVVVEEGDVFRVGKIAFGGTLAANSMRYGAALGFRHGDVFDRSQVMSAIEKINALLASEGARTVVVPVTEIDAEKRTIDLTFEPSKEP
jgi:outer membrane protein insertion porin family